MNLSLINFQKDVIFVLESHECFSGETTLVREKCLHGLNWDALCLDDPIWKIVIFQGLIMDKPFLEN